MEHIKAHYVYWNPYGGTEDNYFAWRFNAPRKCRTGITIFSNIRIHIMIVRVAGLRPAPITQRKPANAGLLQAVAPAPALTSFPCAPRVLFRPCAHRPCPSPCGPQTPCSYTCFVILARVLFWVALYFWILPMGHSDYG